MSEFTGELIGKVQDLLEKLRHKKIDKKSINKLVLSINNDVIRVHNILIELQSVKK